MKKLIAKLMTFVMLVSVITPFAQFENVSAAEPELTLIPNKVMTEGITNLTPNVIESNVPEDQSLLKLQLDDRPGSEYKMEYYLEDNKKVIFTVVKNALDVAHVYYDVIDATTGNRLGYNPKYSVYSTRATNTTANYVRIDTFLGDGHNPDDENHKVLDEDDRTTTKYLPPLYTGITPLFRIRPETGFSFTYDTVTVHFNWDKVSNSIYFATTGMTKGNIYDFKLSHSPDGRTFTEVSKIKFSTGLELAVDPDTKKVTTPIANDTKKSSPAEEHIVNLTQEEYPGDPVVKLTFWFKVPKIWSEEKKVYAPITSSGAFTDPAIRAEINNMVIPVFIESGAVMQVKVANILQDLALGNNPQPLDATVNGSFEGMSIDTANTQREDDIIKVTVQNLPPNTILNSTKITMGYVPNLTSKDTKYNPFEVFTFLKYQVVVQEGYYYIAIDPYPGVTGEYLLHHGITQNNLLPGAKTGMVTPTGTDKILIPTYVKADNKFSQYFKVYFSPGQAFDDVSNPKDAIYSQIYHFQGSEQELSVSVPKDFYVSQYNLIPIPGDITKQQAKLNMTLNWDLGDQSVIEKLVKASPGGVLELVYDVNWSLTPDNTTPTNFSKVKLEIWEEPSTTSQGALKVRYSDYNNSGEVVVKEAYLQLKPDKDSPTGDTMRYYVSPDMIINTISKTNPPAADVPYKLQYPNIYFLNVKPVLQNSKPIEFGQSQYDSITLNDLTKLEVPPPQNLIIKLDENGNEMITTKSTAAGDPINEVSFTAEWTVPGDKLREFLLNSYGITPQLKDNVKMNLYISQNEPYMRSTFSTYNYGKWEMRKGDSNTAPNYDSNVVSIPFNLSGTNNHLLFSNIRPTEASSPVLTYNNSEAREFLRSGKVVRVADIPLSDSFFNSMITSGGAFKLDYKLDGLDKNQKYYVYVDIIVTQVSPLTGETIIDASLLSNLLGVTTKGDKEVPDGLDKVPPAPILNKKDIGLDTATIYWNKILALLQGTGGNINETIEYEIIRIKDNQMDAKHLDNRVPFTEVWKNIGIDFPDGAERAGFRTSDLDLFQFNGSDFSTLADTIKYVYTLDGEIINFKDNSLTPNQLYFYYVRTVRKLYENGNQIKEIYSVWSDISVTTTPLESPKNLQIDTTKEYDEFSEIWIKFDAPISDPSVIGDIVEFQYQLKKDTDDWQTPVTMNSSTLKASAEKLTEDGWYKLYYKITGLEHNTLYNVRVRMVDKDGNASMYTNAATFRTAFDSDKREDEENVKDWIDHLKKELEKLLKNPYWISRNSQSYFEVIYRPSMFDYVLSQSPDGQIELPSKDSGQSIYYIPASAYKKANQANKGFKFTNGNAEIIIPPGAIDLDNNAAILAMSHGLKKGDFKDYFIRISVTNSYADQIEGNETLSNIFEVRIDAVGTTKDIAVWDDELLSKLAKLVIDYASKGEYKDKIENFVKGDALNEELSKYIMNILNIAEVDIINTVSSHMSNFVKTNLPIITFDKPVILAVTGLDGTASVSAYQLINGQWMVKEVTPFGESQAIYTNEPGKFVFVGRIINIPGIDGVDKGGTIVAIVAKYGLDDFLGKGSIDMDSPATRNMVIGSIARMAGAPKGADSVAWLKENKNIVVSSRNMASEISTQESIYLVMCLYEVKTSTKVSTVNIRNISATSNLKLDDKYKQSVRAALELEIYKSQIANANDSITIRQLLEMLGSLDDKTRL